MREIKFRGWDDHYKTWIFGDLKLNEAGDKAIITPRTDGYLVPCCVDRNTVGQFTGLLDCEGSEIYEGDVIASSFADYRAVVEFRNGAFIAVTGPVDTYQALYGVLRLKGLRVIGNVYDNPGLLEATHD